MTTMKNMMKKRIGKMSRIDLLKALLPLEQEQLHDYLFMVLNDYYEPEKVIEVDGQFLYAQGDIPVLLCAHLDTVHKIKPKEENIYFDQEKKIMWSPGGIGADDRCGVYIIIDLLIQGFKPHIAFTWNEEVGGLGARFLSDNLNPKQFDLFAGEHGPINFAIQFDRRGHQQAVYYDLDNQDFEDYISAFGFKTEWGSYTDICEICPAWGFAGVNLSAGYINEHTSSELILVETLEDTLAKAAKILEDQIENPTFFEYKEHARVPYKMPAAGTTYHYNQDYYYGDPDDPDYGYGKWNTSGTYSYGGYDDDLDADVPPSNYTKDDALFPCSHCSIAQPWYNFKEDPDYEDLCIPCYDYIYGEKKIPIKTTMEKLYARRHAL